jgi:thymidylate synthase (FAD)
MYSYELLKDKLPNHKIISNPNNQELNELIAEYGLKKATTIPYLSFRISCPFFVHTQLDRHRVGLAINMVSRRYVDTPPQFWKPKKWRKQSKDNKQASIENEFVEEKEVFPEKLKYFEIETKKVDLDYKVGFDCELIATLQNDWYEENIENEMCKEQARIILPLATFTSFVWTGSLEDYARIYNERTSPLAQIETKEIALEIGKICEQEYPDAWTQLTFKQD